MGDGAPWECPHCDRKFKRKTDLTRHCHAAHSAAERRQHFAETQAMCPPIKKRRRGLSSKGYADHKLLHSGERPFACVRCPAKFVTEARLAQHVLNVHKMDPYECAQCKMTFKRKTDWRTHKCAEEPKQKEKEKEKESNDKEQEREREQSAESRESETTTQPRKRSSKRTKSLFNQRL